MSLIVRDEIELISANIEFHAAHGVDYFVVMDDGSTDGTWEQLQALQKTYEIDLIQRQAAEFKQDEWATELAHRARDLGRADYIISNDADEFWFPVSGSLKSVCAGPHDVLLASRTNMLPFADEVRLPDYRFYESIIRVVKPFQKRRNPNPAIPLDVPFVLTAMPGKVMCSLAGLEQVKRGNHRVEHKRGPAVRTSKLLVYHYPVRRLEKFIRKIRFAKERFALEANPPPRHSHQWRRWAAQDGLGLLTPEWQSMSLDRKQFVRLEADGIVRRDNTMFRYFNRRQSD